MSVSQNVGGRGSGAGVGVSLMTTAAGAAVLPNTGSNQTVSILAIIAVVVGVVALTSQISLFVYKKIAR